MVRGRKRTLKTAKTPFTQSSLGNHLMFVSNSSRGEKLLCLAYVKEVNKM